MGDTGNANNQVIAHDKYCWDCGRTRNKFFCTTCFRGFHAKCLKENEKKPTIVNGISGFICPVCTSLEQSKADLSICKQSNLELLKYTMNQILDDPDFKRLEPLHGEHIVNPIGLNDVKQKVDSMSYDSLDAFLVDIECIHHNYFICDWSNEDIALRLLKWCVSEIGHISACATCYKMKYTHPNYWRTLTCSQPHLIFWIKLDRKIATSNSLPKRGIPYWPAKYFSVGDNGVNVILFCRSTLVEIPIENCFLYATEPPRKQTQTLKSKDIEDALKEVNLYIRNIEQQFGHFEDGLKRVPFNTDLYVKYMRAMFPDYNCGLPNDLIEIHEIKDEPNRTVEFAEPDLNGVLDEPNINYNPSESSVVSVLPKKRAEKTQHLSMAIDRVTQMLKLEPDIDGYVDSDADTIIYNSEEDSPVSNKRQRLSHDMASNVIIDLTPVPSTSRFNYSVEPNSNQNSELPESESTFQEELQSIIKRLQELTKKDNMNKVQIDALRQEVGTLKQANDDFQAKNIDLLGQLKIVTDKCDQAKNEMEKMKEKHANEMNQIHGQIAAAAKTLMESQLVEFQKQHKIQLNAEKQRASDVTEKLKTERENITQLENDVKIANKAKSDVEAQLKKKTDELNNLKSKMKQLLSLN